LLHKNATFGAHYFIVWTFAELFVLEHTPKCGSCVLEERHRNGASIAHNRKKRKMKAKRKEKQIIN
jgi:hypothetical protein